MWGNSLAEFSSILRHKDEDIQLQSATFYWVRPEQPITCRQAEELQNRKSIHGAGYYGEQRENQYDLILQAQGAVSSETVIKYILFLGGGNGICDI